MIKKVPLDSLREIDPRVTMRQVGDILHFKSKSYIKFTLLYNQNRIHPTDFYFVHF